MQSRGQISFIRSGDLCWCLMVAWITTVTIINASARHNAATTIPQPMTSQSPLPAQAVISEKGISEARQHLAKLGYWVKEDVIGLDESLRHALIAFQKIEGRQRTGRLTLEDLQTLQAARRPLALESGSPHIEIDLNRQVLFIVDGGGLVSKILPISSGSGKLFTEGGRTRRAYTPCGQFTVYRKIAGWRKSPLGLLYYPNYIVGGVAIHGNPAVPAYPASHGCIRIPMFAAREFSEMMPIGTVVIVYDDELLVLSPMR